MATTTAKKTTTTSATTMTVQVMEDVSRYGGFRPTLTVNGLGKLSYRAVRAMSFKLAAAASLASESERWVISIADRDDKPEIHLELCDETARERRAALAMLNAVAARAASILA